MSKCTVLSDSETKISNKNSSADCGRTEMLKVLYVTQGFHSAIGGAQSASRDWILKMSEKVDAHLLTDRPSMMKRVLTKSSLSFLIAANPLTFLEFSISMTRRMNKVCKKLKPDLVHILSHSGFVVIPPESIPTIVTLHDEPFLELPENVSPPLYQFLVALLQRSENFMRNLMLSRRPYLHATGEYTAIFAREKYPNLNYRVIPNPAVIANPRAPSKSKDALFQELDIPSNSRTVLTVGNINFRKAIHKILDAAKILADENYHFIVVGKTANFISKGYLRAIHKRKKKRDIKNLHLTGFVSDEMLHNLYSYADYYLSASQSEACSLALIEAAAYGIPIIATDVGAAAKLFGEKGRIIDRHSDGMDIARIILSWDPERRLHYNTLEKLSEARVVSQMLDYYEAVTK